MNKKMLIVVSIFAAAILILVSFNSVIGFQKDESTTKKILPLYSIRTNKEIDTEVRDQLEFHSYKNRIFNDNLVNTNEIENLNFTYYEGTAVMQCNDDRYILAAMKGIFEFGDPNIYEGRNTVLSKYNLNGEMVWSKNFFILDGCWSYSVLQTKDDGYILGGIAISESLNFYAMLIKTDRWGNQEWIKTYPVLGEADGSFVQKTYDNGYILIGGSRPVSTEPFYLYILKTDENGNEEWNKTFDFGFPFSIQQTIDNKYIITGINNYNLSDPFASEIYLLKIDNNGYEEWNKTYRFFNSNWGVYAQQIEDEGYIVVGTGINNEEIRYYTILLKTDKFGNEAWNKTFSGDWLGFQAQSAQQTEDKGYIIGGQMPKEKNYDTFLLKTDELGNEEWNKTYSVLGGALSCFVQQTNDLGYIFTGATYKTFQEYKTYQYLVKTDENGNVEWAVNKNKKASDDLNQIENKYAFLNLNFLKWFFKELPNIFPLLRQLLGL